MTELAATFRKPFAEQVNALRLRLQELRPTFGSADPRYSQHDRAFMVAGAVKADLLADLARAVDKAVHDGTGFAEFKKDFRAIVEKHGWHGWTGEGSKRGEEWRMRTIYRTNMRTSYMAGRYAQLVDGGYKYWVYRHSGAAHPRLDHLSWDGVALPPDHPFWRTHYPPNGWGCGCDVEGANTEAGIKRMGGDPSRTLPDGWDVADPRTGTLPGIGKSWDHAPGATVVGDILAFDGKLAKLPAQIGADFNEGIAENAMAARIAAFTEFVDEALANRPTGKTQIAGAMQPSWIRELNARGVSPQTAEIAMRDRDVQHMFRDAKSAQIDKGWLYELPRHLSEAAMVLLEDDGKGGHTLVLVFAGPNQHTKLIVKIDYQVKKQGVMNILRSGRLITPAQLRTFIGSGAEVLEGRL